MAMHHRLRGGLCAFVDVQHAAGTLDAFLVPVRSLATSSVSPTLNARHLQVLQKALRSPQFDDQGWSKDGPGRFVSQRTELKLDLQTGEVLWRNDNLKPVPDSIAQFSDYQAFFQGRSLHCGVVAKQQHRQWIHVVGTEYDLIEWDEPNTSDQGVGCPKAPEQESAAEEEISPEVAEATAQLMSFGFEYPQCIKGLKLHDNNVEATANWLFSGAPDIDPVVPPIGGPLGLGLGRRQPQVRSCLATFTPCFGSSWLF